MPVLSDSTVALWREGYEFVPRRCRAAGVDLFETRLLLRPVVCMSGAEAAREFYVPDRFARQGALPPTALTLLQDHGSAQVLHGPAHRHRKQMLLSLTGRGRFERLLELAAAEWRAAAGRWQRRALVTLHAAAHEVLCRAACTWTGVPLREDDVAARARELAAMIDGAGAIGPRQWRGQLLRQRTERWLRGVIVGARRGTIDAPAGTALATIAQHRELDGRPLDTRTAAVELLNLIRPTVAVANFVVFAAKALHEHARERARVREGGAAEAEAFAQEVRRLAPFFPLVGGRVAQPFAWRGHDFGDGDQVLLDIYGTNRDPRAWDDADAFRPGRFDRWEGDPFTLIPQGGGDHANGHRCAGEWVTIGLLREAIGFLAREIAYDVPPQDLAVDLGRLPALPASGFRIARVRA